MTEEHEARLPRTAEPRDEAAAPPPEDRPQLNKVDSFSHRGEPSIVLGEGNEAWMAQSDQWIEAERQCIYRLDNME